MWAYHSSVGKLIHASVSIVHRLHKSYTYKVHTTEVTQIHQKYLAHGVLYLVSIHCYLLTFSIILYTLPKYLVFSLVPINSALLSYTYVEVAKVWSTGKLLSLLDVTANYLAKVALSFTSEFSLNWLLFQFNKQLFNRFNRLLYAPF